MQLGTLLTLLGALSVAQALLVAAAVLGRRSGAHPAVAVLGGLLLCGALALGAILLSHQWRENAALWSLEVVCTAVLGPLFYAWVARILEEERRGRLRVHLALPAMLAVWELLTLLRLSVTGRLLPQPAIGAVLLLQASYTCAAAALLAARWRQPEARQRRAVVATLVALLAIVHLASLTRSLAPRHRLLIDLVPGASILLIYAVGFLALRQPRLLYLDDAPVPSSPPASPLPTRTHPSGEQADAGHEPPQLVAPDAEREPERRRYESSPLSSEQVAALRARLLAHLDRERPYLRCDLTLPELARQLDTLPTHLSRAINEGGESFPDLLARLRVEEAIRLLGDPALDHLTVEALGRRAGFGSRTAFYDVFRRRVGVTPSVARRQRADAARQGTSSTRPLSSE